MKPFKITASIFMILLILSWICIYSFRNSSYIFALSLFGSATLGFIAGVIGWRYEGRDGMIITLTILHGLIVALCFAFLIFVFFFMSEFHR